MRSFRMKQFKTLMLGVVLLKAPNQKQTIGRVGGGGWEVDDKLTLQHLFKRSRLLQASFNFASLDNCLSRFRQNTHLSLLLQAFRANRFFILSEAFDMSDGRRRKAWVSLKILQLESVLLSASCLLAADDTIIKHVL